MIKRTFLTGVTTHALASEAAKAAALVGLKGVTVRAVDGGWRAVQETKADLGAAASREFGGSVARERVTRDDAQWNLEVEASWKAVELLDEVTDRERELGQVIGADSLGKRTRRVKTFATWFEAREFQRSLLACGLSERQVTRSQNVVEWITYNGFVTGKDVRDALEARALALAEAAVAKAQAAQVARVATKVAVITPAQGYTV